MLKYVNTDVVFQEIPNEVTLAVNVSGCPCRCPGCHSKYLWEDTGLPLDKNSIDRLIATVNDHITCVAFMGGDADPKGIDELARHIKKQHPELKVAWYSGRTCLSAMIDKQHFDYLKIGPYLRHLGGLQSETTNQRLYRRTTGDKLIDITHLMRHDNGSRK